MIQPKVDVQGDVLIFTPFGKDANLICRALNAVRISTKVCSNIFEFCDSINDDVCAALVTNEVLNGQAYQHLIGRLIKQPSWSDLPIIILSNDKNNTESLMENLADWANISILERPLQTATLLSAVKSALRARQRQYETRSLLVELEKTNKVKDETIETLTKTERELINLAAIVASSYDPIMSITLEGVILGWNPSAEKLYGHKSREISGRHLSYIFLPQYATDIPKLLMTIDRGETITDFETAHLNKDGSSLPVALTIFPVKDNNDSIINASIIVRDLTERKYIEKERAKLLRAHIH